MFGVGSVLGSERYVLGMRGYLTDCRGTVGFGIPGITLWVGGVYTTAFVDFSGLGRVFPASCTLRGRMLLNPIFVVSCGRRVGG